MAASLVGLRVGSLELSGWNVGRKLLLMAGVLCRTAAGSFRTHLALISSRIELNLHKHSYDSNSFCRWQYFPLVISLTNKNDCKLELYACVCKCKL